ncbi:MAG: adenosylcobinamide-GDP ribazoletransferase [Candidatus Omnitrophota bacterium]
MSSFLLAVQFLTIIPLEIKEAGEDKIAKAMIYFPLVGLLLGIALSGINAIFSVMNFPSLVVSIILVVTLIAITGGMHLDGLSDTADAFLSGKPKEDMLNIMRDSHIGVMGVLSLISILFLETGLLFSLSAAVKTAALVLMCVLSRWSAVLSMFLFPYARTEGKAKVFIRGMNPKIFIFSTLIAISCVIAAWGVKGLVLLLAVTVCVYLSGKSISRRIGGITGDTLGATIELSEVIILFGICLMERSGGIWIR